MTGGDPAGFPPHLAALPPGRQFGLWRASALRAPGFCFDELAPLAAPRVAAAADRALDGGPGSAAWEAYERAFASAAPGLAAALHRAVSRPAFLTAVTWQNPGVVRNWLRGYIERPPPPGPGNRRARQRQATLVSYLQRYAAKNDTIGFFGPVAWARWGVQDTPVEIRGAIEEIAERTVHLECWAVDAVAVALCQDEELRAHVAPRRVPSDHLEGDTLYRERGRSQRLTADEAAALRLADGERSAGAIVAELLDAPGTGLSGREDALEVLRRLAERGLLVWDLRGPHEPFPERTLAQRLRLLPPSPATEAARRRLDKLVAARDEVGAAADPATLLERVTALERCFETLTGTAGRRAEGEHYAGRTLLYCDARRAGGVRLSEALLREAGPVLEGLLLAARWFTARIAEAARSDLAEVFRRASAARGRPRLLLGELLTLANPRILRDEDGPVAVAAHDLCARFDKVLGQARHDGDAVRLSPETFHAGAAALFGDSRPGWAAARYHSPDLMIDAPSVEAIARGDYRIVVGELHAGLNSLESRVFATHQERPGELEGFAAADMRGVRVLPALPKGWSRTTSRTYPPPVFRAAGYEHYAIGRDLGVDADPAIPAGALEVSLDGDDLTVATRDGRWQRPLIEVLGEFLTMAAARRFRVFGDEGHTPRVEVGRVVVARRTWRFDLPSLAFRDAPAGAERFAAARAWARDHGLPRHVFATPAGEEKPYFVDLASPLLVDNLARLLRAAERRSPRGWALQASEMLPGPGGLWLAGARGRYTSELRVVAVDLTVPADAAAAGTVR